MGVVGGLMPSPLHFIALAQVALNRWTRAIFVLVGAPLIVDAALLALTFFLYRWVPHSVSHDIAYVGGAALILFGSYSLIEMRRRSQAELSRDARMTYASVAAALLAEVTAPGTWIYWLTIAGPILAEGRQTGYLRVVPFFAGSLIGYYGSALASLLLLAWGASLHKAFKQRMLLIANVLLLVLGVVYIFHARFGR